MKEGLIQVDGPLYFCCKRYHFYSLHSLKCQLENSLGEDEDIQFAPVKKKETNL